MILGAPFFRNTTIQFDYEYHHITIFGKVGSSTIVPDSDSSPDSTTTLGGGAIAGIVIGSFLVLLLIVGIVTCVVRSKKSKEASREAHYGSINDEDAVINNED